MKTIAFFVIVLTASLSTASIALSQAKSPIEGVWKITQWIERGDTINNPQPSLFIFTSGYYSVAMLMSPRTDSIRSDMGREVTDAEKIGLYEQWKWFVGISGSYEVKESTVVMHSIVAKTTWDMNRQTLPEFKLEGSNTLWLIPTATGARKGGLRMKLTKLE